VRAGVRSEPLFTVVIPAFNAERTVAAAIRSVLAQRFQDFEVIVVDDGSTDGTSDEVRQVQDERIRLVRQGNEGSSAARNAALRIARGAYASFLDADDLLLPDFLTEMQEAFARRPDAGIVDCAHWLLEERTGRIAAAPQSGPEPLPDDPAEMILLLLRENIIWGTATVPMSVLTEVRGFRPSLRACVDYELWLRIVARGHRVVRAPGTLVVWRRTGETLSSDPILMTRTLCEVFRLVAEEYDVPEPVRALARSRREQERRRLGALTGERRVAAAALRTRHALGRLRRRLTPSPFGQETTADVMRAFPETVPTTRASEATRYRRPRSPSP
jgi:hypothetical protein